MHGGRIVKRIISSEGCIELPRDWRECTEFALNWIREETAIAKRVLRLRNHLYLKVPWIETADMVDYLISTNACEVPRHRGWLTVPDYLDSSGKFLHEHQPEFERRQRIYDDWVNQSSSLGYYAEGLFRKAFLDAGYSVQKVTFNVPPSVVGFHAEGVEIDVLCVKGDWRLGVQVKNVTSEVFIDPGKIQSPTDIYLTLSRQFEFCSSNGIIPILFAPFIDGSFYCFDDTHKGLHCQTLLQFFNKENSELCRSIKEVLKFGNVRMVEELPPHIRSWVDRIPEMWNRRHGFLIRRPR